MSGRIIKSLSIPPSLGANGLAPDSMHSGNRDHESKDQIIEIDDYKIVDEIENRVAEGHKVVKR
ncbi:MAG: hypothetical protein MUO26_01210 [Methanotrichaceae archaeon]|nr:hypothetical protein [Methanotrichaceae archaeon]